MRVYTSMVSVVVAQDSSGERSQRFVDEDGVEWRVVGWNEWGVMKCLDGHLRSE